MLMHVRMMFARTRPNVGTHMDRISAFVKMDGRVTPVTPDFSEGVKQLRSCHNGH